MGNTDKPVNTFWCYVTPLVGAWVADEFWGRLKTIHVSISFAVLGHIILIMSALPPVISNPGGALGCFSVGLVIFGIGVGGFKYAHLFKQRDICKTSRLTSTGQTSLPSSLNSTGRPIRTSRSIQRLESA